MEEAEYNELADELQEYFRRRAKKGEDWYVAHYAWVNHQARFANWKCDTFYVRVYGESVPGKGRGYADQLVHKELVVEDKALDALAEMSRRALSFVRDQEVFKSGPDDLCAPAV